MTRRLTGHPCVVALFAASLLGLFLEVCLIRWHATEFRAAAYFKNVTLLACFLGLGLGFALAGRRRDYFPLTLLLLTGHVIVFDLLSRLGVDSVIRHPQTPSGFWLWSVQPIETASWGQQLGPLAIFYGFFLSLLVTTALVFLPIGQLTGRLMAGFAPIRAYTINILGSIAGVLLFTAVSYLWLPPVCWFGIAAAVTLGLMQNSRRGLARSLPFGVALLVWLGVDWGSVTGLRSANLQHIYSPYQHLELQPFHVVNPEGLRLHRGMAVFANKSYHLRATDLSRRWIDSYGAQFPWTVEEAIGYELPYVFCLRAKDVLVVGSGAGNDVAACLRNSGPDGRVDAVEIDPAIWIVGRRHHPEQPYLDPRVTVHIDDARHFLQRTSRQYDLIVFGLVDSHTLLSGLGNLRLENFLYTHQAFAEAKARLRPGGWMAVSFCTSPTNHVSLRIYKMLRDLFPEAPPRAFRIGADGGTLFVAGGGTNAQPSLAERVSAAEVTSVYTAMRPDEFPPEATDNWPFLYMSKREIPRSYLGLVVLLLLVAIPWIRKVFGPGGTFDAHFFFLGAAFLLVEVKGITELALVWGTTWVVNSVAIVAILVFVLLANLYVSFARPVRLRPYYVGLAVTLVVGFLLPVERVLDYGWHVAALVSAALLFSPLVFAGVIFATSLRSAPSVPAAFASNLMGAILGGCCEYAAMALGFRAMYVLAFALYAASYLFRSLGSTSRAALVPSAKT